MNTRDWYIMQQQQGAPQMSGATGAVMSPHMQPPHASNPISTGASQAREQAHHSLSMLPSPEEIEHFRSAMGMPGKRPEPSMGNIIGGSLLNAFSDLGTSQLRGSHSPAAQHWGNSMLMSHEQEALRKKQEQAQIDENIKIMQYLTHMAERKEQREYQEASLQETSRHHRAIEGKGAQEDARNTMVLPNGETIDLSGYANIVSKSQHAKMSEGKQFAGQLLHSVNKALDQLEDLDKTAERHGHLSPTNPYYGKLQQKSLEMRGTLFNNKAAAETRNKTKLLNDNLTAIRVSNENAIKKGTAGEQMMKRWEQNGILPHINDSSETIRQKLGEIKKDATLLRAAQDISLKHGKVIDVMDLENIFGKNHEIGSGEEEKQPSIPIIQMKDPNGKMVEVEADDEQGLQNMINSGYTMVK